MSEMPTADEIFTRNTGESHEPDDLAFDDVGEVDNALAVPLVATLRALRQALSRADSYRHALKQAIELLNQLITENRSLKRRNAELLEQVRETKR